MYIYIYIYIKICTGTGNILNIYYKVSKRVGLLDLAPKYTLQISKEGVRWSLLQRTTVKSHYMYQHLSTCSLEVSGVDLNGAVSTGNLRLDLLVLDLLSPLLIA